MKLAATQPLFRAIGVCLSALALAGSSAWAKPPKVDALFPAGGQRGQTVAITARGAFESWPMNVWVDDPQLRIAAGEQPGQLRVAIDAGAAPGVRLARLFNSAGASALAPLVVGLVAERQEQEPNNEPASAERVELPLTVNGVLGADGDVDVFATQLRAGQTLVASVEAQRTLASPMDGLLQALTSDGRVLQQENDSPGLDPRLVFTAPGDGVYLVRLLAYPASGTASIQLAGGDKFIYRLTLSTDGLLDFTLPLAVRRPAAESPAQAAAPNWRLLGWNVPDGLTPTLAPSSSDAARLIAYHPKLAGLATVAKVADPVLVEAEPNSPREPQAITTPAVICGCIGEAGDTDVFAFRASAGTKLGLAIESRSLGFPLDAVLRVTDAAGKVLSTADDQGKDRDPDLAFTVPADGECRAVVADLCRQGSARHAYRLSIAPIRADYELSLAASDFTAVAGKTVEIPVTIDRRHDLTDEIEIQCAALPAGAKCEPVVSAAKGDSAKKVKLIVTAGDQLFAGPIRVVGRSRGAAPIERLARFTLSEGVSTTSVWLTIAAP